MKNELPPIDLEALTARGMRMSVAVLSLNSQKSRAADWSIFSRWCERAGRVAMPAEEATMKMFAVYELDRGSCVKTVVHRCCTVSSIHKDAGLPSPCGPGVNSIFRGARRDLTRKKSRGPKSAITPAELLAISDALGSTPQGIRDRALIVFGFHTAMRRSEISDLDLSDLNFGPDGITVVIKKSKRDQEGKGVQLGIFPGQNVATCPVQTLLAWIEIRGTWPGALFCSLKGGRPPSPPAGPARVRVRNRRSEVWPRVRATEHRGKEASASLPLEILYQRLLDEHPSTGSTVPAVHQHLSHKRLQGFGINTAVKRAVALIGKDPAHFGAHTLRASMVTAALSAGEDIVTIMRRTRHKSLQVLQGYDRPALFSHNPLKGTGL